jgi:hypothetical protein
VDPPAHVAGVRKERAVIQAIDQHTRPDTGAWVKANIRIPPELLDPPKHGVVRGRAPTHNVDDRERDRDPERPNHADGDDPIIVVAAMMTSKRWVRASVRHASGSISPTAAPTMTAPRVAFGRYRIGSVRKRRVRRAPRRPCPPEGRALPQ